MRGGGFGWGGGGGGGGGVWEAGVSEEQETEGGQVGGGGRPDARISNGLHDTILVCLFALFIQYKQAVY